MRRAKFVTMLCASWLAVSCGPKPPVETKTPDDTAGEEGTGVTDEVVDEEAPEPHVVDVQLFVMSGCKYAAQIVPSMYEVEKTLGDKMSYTQYHVFNVAVDGSTMKCLFGQDACLADRLQLCTQELAPQKTLALSTCMFESSESLSGAFDGCAAEVGLDPGPVKECADGKLGKKLVLADVDVLNETGVKGSPTLFIDGEAYRGGRDAQSLVTAVCLALPEGERPDDCPEVEPVHLTVINDQRCEKCGEQADKMVDHFDSMFWDLQVNELDWSQKEARDLMEKVGVKLLPAYVFDADVEGQGGFAMLQNHVTESGDHWVIDPGKVNSKFDPTKEICDNGIDDTGDGLVDCQDAWCDEQLVCAEVCDNGVDDTDDGLVDCDDPDCVGQIVCREETEATLDMFVMSHCPYGVKAVNQIPEVLSKLGDVKFKLHYITSVLDEAGYKEYARKAWCKQYDDGMWYCSMHGSDETDENIRQVCAADVAPARYLDYILCRNADLGNEDWESCASQAKIPLKKMRKCIIAGDGLELLKKNVADGEAMGISASPTYLINNKYLQKISPTPGHIMQAICQHNDQLTACDGLEPPEKVSVPTGCAAKDS